MRWVLLQYYYSMTSEKFSISLTPELSRALNRLAKQRKEDRSRLIEILLRENPLVSATVRTERGPANPGTKNGRDVRKLLALGDLGRRQWESLSAQGKVGFVDR